ncbi:MAG: polysaccharide biosynthesis protein [Clostridium sp.]|nr:polysaccharide biosynthesis protein [Clostridium sp.]
MKSSFAAPGLVSKKISPRKMAFITGTLLLTSTGFVCRILGFFYRIFMSRTIGAEGLGIYNMVHPIFSICFAVCAGSIQTALSQYVAANQSKGKAVFKTGLMIAMGLSLIMAWGIYGNAGFLAEKLLLEPRCAPYLPVIAVSVPFAALHACINGYYYGMQKARVPAFSQVAEQVIRMGAVFLMANVWLGSGREITVSLAVYGHLIGEMASALFTMVSLGFFPPESAQSRPAQAGLSFRAAAVPLMALALPLMGNRLILNVLGSAEAIWIPNKLMGSGLSNSEALSIYGVLTSMALPFILFPSAITNSMAVLLLPTVAQAQADGNEGRISSIISMSLRYSCYMGILCIGIFTMFGNQLGVSVFHDQNAGRFITILSWLCPFMYLATTMGSILNGLGKTSVTFVQNVWAMVIRLAFVLFAIPRFGILGYLYGMLVSELTLALMSFLAVKRLVPFRWDSANMIVKPTLLLLVSIGIYLAFSQALDCFGHLPVFIETAIHITLISMCYMGLLLLFHKKKPLP